MLLFHRMIVHKRFFSIGKDADFIALVILTLAYAAIIIFFYPDFLTVILPDVLNFYLHYDNPAAVYPRAIQYGLFASVCLAASIVFQQRQEPPLLPFLFACALLCLFVFVIQMKGFYYHLLPMFAFLVPATALGLYRVLSYFIGKETTILLPGFTAAVFIAAYIQRPLLPDYPTHQDYKNAPLTRFIEQECAQPCSFFMTHENLEIVSQTAFYTGFPYATRFPAYWFIPGFNLQTSQPENIKNSAAYRQKIESAHKRYADYVAQDLERYTPSLLLIMQNPPHTPKEVSFDYFSFFSISPAFKKISENYEKTGTFSTDRAYYFRDTKYDFEYMLTWDVYKKKETPKP